MQNKTKPKPAKKKKTTDYERKTITLPPAVVTMGDNLAKRDGRTFSNLIAALIRRDAERVGI